MNNISNIRESLRVVLIGNNVFLQSGLEAMLGRKVCTDISEEEVMAGSGLLLLAPEGTVIQKRIKMLSLINSMNTVSGWRGINLVDRRDKKSVRFAHLTGLPVLDLNLGKDELLQHIMSCMRKKTEIRSDSIGRLTTRQWEAISVSLDENHVKRASRKSTFYNHRMSALRRLRLLNMHELRLLVSDCNF
ncbi:hypothetical protein C2O24_20390 [Salmonella enterica]|nr:hypothetical protein [Salmonella enterica]EHE7525192.1 hypothetical protein [Salmonella enterica subsp. enterica serovar Isangi]EBF1559230.1 hypothetical protein [Salmonella enterica]EID1930757.1 hypothetical protein [Salmonella enterica]EIL8751357.1 hypothetical protein [Salmonella enterica]